MADVEARGVIGRTAYIGMILVLISGCDKQRDHNLVRSEVGRFQYYPPAGEMPAVLLDTVTGCVETFGKATSLENPKDVAWWRSYADGGVPAVTYENGKAISVPNSAPPQRCGRPKEENK